MSIRIRKLGKGAYGTVELRKDVLGRNYARKIFEAKDLRHAQEEFETLRRFQHAAIVGLRVFYSSFFPFVCVCVALSFYSII